jgi:hypothetical protein
MVIRAGACELPHAGPAAAVHTLPAPGRAPAPDQVLAVRPSTAPY